MEAWWPVSGTRIRKTAVLKHRRYYGAMYLTDPKSGHVFLFGRDYELRQGRSGKRRIVAQGFVAEYPSEEAMLAAIKADRMKPLPEWVDRVTIKYVPSEFRRAA